ncbi:SGNH/GDSL hydrolase family protein [Roseimaritima ulvae]|uniref:GDSL-like Lipase/Acylhydrolase n=1 Tax=Roseimaritima ulvae TaxID=980254 RepID=A0A5B9QYG4_9BACT|nr:SGNH/GDSL hydrolase family protein [Roseimaritima ulvae]QEG38973.1 hypothetical protein UC8_09340 [Roseimaritima ulvae]
MADRPRSRPSRRRRKIIPLIVLGLAMACALLIAEVGLRVVGFSYPITTQGDAWCGYGFVPNSQWTHTREGHSQVTINAFGFRDDPWTIEKPAGVTRIAVLGDSFIAGLEVEKPQRFTEVLSQQLNAASRSDAAVGQTVYEVMNFGQPGFGTAQELMVLRHKVWQFQPDMVLLAMFTGNDIRNNSRQLEAEPMLPYFDLTDEGLRLDESYRDQQRGLPVRIVKTLAPYSRLLQLVYRSFHSLTREPPPDDPRDLALRTDYGLYAPLAEALIYQEPTDDAWRQAWQTTEALVAEFQRECHDHNAQLRVITLSNDMQVHTDPQLRSRLEQLTPIDDWFYPDQRIAACCQQHDIPALNLAAELQRYAAEHRLALHGFDNTRLGVGHWNADGHRVAAEKVAAWLSEPQPPNDTEP